jgi:protocatechuate 3,4-dioxygenase beta subunit
VDDGGTGANDRGAAQADFAGGLAALPGSRPTLPGASWKELALSPVVEANPLVAVPIPRDAIRRALRALPLVLAVLVILGGLPGASLQRVEYEAVAPPVPAEVTDRSGELDVTVLDGAGGPPLAGARVRALAMVDGRAYQADACETDGHGVAKLVGLPRGEAWVLADAPGRARGSSRLVVDAGARALVIELLPEHAIDVTVRDELGKAVGRAEIEVSGPGDLLPVGARAGPDGFVVVRRLGDGPWRVTARSQGYEEATGRASKDGEPVTLVMRRLGSIDVSVVGPSGEPVDKARVLAAGAMLWPARAADTDATGHVRLAGLAAGTYALRATAGDLVSAIELGVALGRGEDKQVELRLGLGRWVNVLVTDGEGDDAGTIAQARVTLAEQGLSPFPFEATTDARGHARLGPIAPGDATLSARADGFVPRGAVAVADPPPPETRVPLVRAGTLTGRVVDARGYPVDGATIEIVGSDPTGAPIYDDPRRSTFQAAHFNAMLGGPAMLVPAGELGVMPGPVPAIPHQGLRGVTMPADVPHGSVASVAEPWVTRADGTFRATPASPGRVRAIVHHPQYVEAQSDLVTLLPGGEANVDIVMHEGGTLEGRVLDARDRPVEGARVLVAATRGSFERSTRTASDGTFAFASLPSDVTLTAGVDDDDNQPDVRMTASIPEGGKAEITVHLPEARDPLPVTVVDERGRPVDFAQVSASSLAAEAPLRTTAFTDKNGETSLKRARGVALRVEVSAPGHAPRIVTTDGKADSLRLEMSPAETATGEVVTARGRDAVAGAEVTLYTNLGVRRARTDASGTFSLRDLSPGPAKVSVRAAGFAPVAREVAIPDTSGRRAVAIPRIELSTEGVVEGDVVDGSGKPVPGARVARDHVPTWLLVGANPAGIAVTDGKGHFALAQLPEGTVTLEAYAPDVGRGKTEGIKVTSGRTTIRTTITLVRDAGEAATKAPAVSGGVAVTLGETGEPVAVVVVSVVEGSEAERAGLAPGDVLVTVDGVEIHTMAEARSKLGGPVADDVLVGVRRGDQALTLRVTREAVRR